MSNRRLILVEDDPEIARLIQRTLEKTGRFEVIWTENPAEVLALSEQGACDGVIMDVSLANSQYQGKDVDGLMITRLLKSNPRARHIPVMLLTAHAMHGDTERFLSDSGADAYLSKPFENRQVLLDAVNELLKADPETRIFRDR